MKGYTSYKNFTNNGLGLGPTGTHLLHGGIVAGGVYAVGKYADVEALQVWWAPLAGGLAGILGSIIVDKMLMDDLQSYELFEARVMKELSRHDEWTNKGWTLDEGRFTEAYTAEVNKILKSAKAIKAKKPEEQLAPTG